MAQEDTGFGEGAIFGAIIVSIIWGFILYMAIAENNRGWRAEAEDFGYGKWHVIGNDRRKEWRWKEPAKPAERKEQ